MSNVLYIIFGALLPISVFVLPPLAWGWPIGYIVAAVFAVIMVFRLMKMAPRILGLPLMVAVTGLAIYTLAAPYGVLALILPIIYYVVAFILNLERKAE